MEEWEQLHKPLRDLIEIIQFTENVSAKMQGILDEAQIYRTVREEFAKSKRYTASILLLTDDGSKLRIAKTSLSPKQLKAGEKASDLQLKGFKIDLNKSSTYSQVVREGKTLQSDVSDVIGELLPRPVASLISKIMGYEDKKSILTPLKRHGKIIGAFAMSSTDLAEHLIPSVRNLAHHISTALELADEHAVRKRANEELRKYREHLEELVEASSGELMKANEQLQREITERKGAEEALRRAEHEKAIILDNMLEHVEYYDTQMRVLWANRASCQSVGLAADQLVGRHCYEIWHQRSESCVGCPAVRACETGQLQEGEITTPDGTVWFIRGYPVLDANGDVIGMVSVSLDITERKRAEDEIKRRNERLAALNAIAATVSSSLDLQEILDRALDKVLEVAGVEVGSMYVLDEQAEELVLATYRGVAKEFADQVRNFKMGESLTGAAAQFGEPVVLDDLTGDPGVTTTLVSEEGIRSFASIPMKSREKVQGVMHIASHKYHPFSPAELQLYTAIANQIGVAIENARLWYETKRRLRESAIVLEVSQALASILELEELLQLIVDSAVKTIGAADGGMIYLLDDATGELLPRASSGKAAGVIGKARMQIGKGIAGLALEQGKVINVPEVDADPRFIAWEDTHGFKSLLVAPLLADGRRIGTISIQSRQAGAFSAADENLIMALGTHAAIAVKNAQLFARSEQLAITRERHRIASEIHDGLAQNLASLLMKVDFCLGLFDSDPQETKAILAKVKALLQEIIRGIRLSIFALRPLDLEKLGLLPALRKYAREFEEQNELPVHLSIAGEEAQSQVPPTHGYTLFGIIQEALNNVRKHAMASNVWMLLDLSTPDVVSLTIRDDGVGFDRKAVERMASLPYGGGYGLTSMKERAKRLGGELTVEAEPGLGTKITAILPLRKRG